MWHWEFDAWWMRMMMFVFWAAMIGVAVRAIRSATGRSETGPSHRRTLEVLEERYARGEIDEDEFRHRGSILESTSG